MQKITLDNLELALMENLIELSGKYLNYQKAIDDCQKVLEDLGSKLNPEERKKLEMRANVIAYRFVDLVLLQKNSEKLQKETGINSRVNDVVNLPRLIIKKED